MLWDVAAGVALVKAAGGVVRIDHGESLEDEALTVSAAANPTLITALG